MSLNYVAVLALSVVVAGLSAFVVGLLAGKLSVTHPKRAVWALGAVAWTLTIVAVYSVLRIQFSILLDSIVFACVLSVTYVSARSGYRFSSSTAHVAHSAMSRQAGRS